MQQRPDLVQVEAQIQHSQRRRDNAIKEREKAEQAAEKQRDELRRLQTDLETVKKAADDAMGKFPRAYMLLRY